MALEQDQIAGIFGGGVVQDLTLGEAFTGPKAVYPKLKKTLLIDATNDKLKFNEGTGDLEITLTHGTFNWPYTSTQTEIKTLMEAAGNFTYTVSMNEVNMKIASTGSFYLANSAANSVLPTLGFGAIDLADFQFHRAAEIHAFTHVLNLYLTDTDVPETTEHFSGIVEEGGALGDVVNLLTFGEVNGYSGLEFGAEFFLNGNAGEISTTPALEVTRVGETKDSAEILVLDAQDFKVAPDTDFDPNTTDGVIEWKNKPEWPGLVEADIDFFGFGVSDDGRKIVVMQVNDLTTAASSAYVSYSTDGGLSFTRLDGVHSEAFQGWLDDDNFRLSLRILVDDENVMIVYPREGALNRKIFKGLYGQFQSDGSLRLFKSNLFKASPHNGSITQNNATNNYDYPTLEKRNGVIYFCIHFVGNRRMFMYVSYDNGLSWTDNINVKTGSSPLYSFTENYQMFLDDVPGATITPGEKVTNGDFSTGDLTNWVDSSQGTGSVVVNADNQAVFTNAGSGNYGELRQTLNLSSNKSYILEFDIINNSGDEFVANDQIVALVFDNAGFSGAQDLTLKIPLSNGRAKAVFQSSTGVGGLRFSYESTSGTTNKSFIIDNVSVEEVLPNRVSILANHDSSNPAGYNVTHNMWLAYTDDQNLGNPWETALVIPPFSGGAWNLHLGVDRLNDTGLRAFWVINGHSSGFVTGLGVVHAYGTGSNWKSADVMFSTIDFGASPPTITTNSFEWRRFLYGGGSTATFSRLASYQGNDSNHSLGKYYNQTPNVLVAPTATSALAVQRIDQFGLDYLDSSMLCYIADTNNPLTSTHFLGLHKRPGVSWANEGVLAKTDSKLFLIERLLNNTDAQAYTEGRVQAREITLNDGNNPELVADGDFATDTEGVSWFEESPGCLNITGGAAVIAYASDNGFYQEITTEVGVYYNIQWDVIDVSGAVNNDLFVSAKANLSEPTDSTNPQPLARKAMSGELGGTVNGTTQGLTFQATSTTTRLVFGVGGNVGGTAQITNISCKKHAIQLGNAIDIMDKPNIDEQGVAKWLQVKSTTDSVHVMALKERKVDDTADLEQLAYNKFGLQDINVGVIPQLSPTEIFDNNGSNAMDSLSNFAFDENDPNIGVQVHIAAASTVYQTYTTIDGGVTWVLQDQLNSIDTVFSVSGLGALDHNYSYRPQIFIKDKKVCILFIAGPNDTGRQVKGAYGTMDAGGSLALEISNAGFTSDVIAPAATYCNNFTAYRGASGRIYAVARIETGGFLDIAVSDDDGATFTDGVGAPGTKSRVKNTATSVVAGAGSAPLGIFEMPDPDNPSNQRLVVMFTDVALHAAFTDNSNLNTNWDALYNLEISGGAAKCLLGFGVSPEYKLVVMCNDTSNNTTIFSTLHDFNLTTPVELVDYGNVNTNWSMGGFGVDSYNGYSVANSSLKYYRYTLNRVIWTSNNSFLFCVGTNVVAGWQPVFVKCYDALGDQTSIIPLSTVFTNPVTTNSRTEISLHKTANGRMFMLNRREDSLNATTRGASGRIESREIIDVTPMASNIPKLRMIGDGLTNIPNEQPYNDLSNKPSLSGNRANQTTGVVVGDSLIVSYLGENKAGFGSMFINHIKERELNDLAEGFRQVPILISEENADVGPYDFDRSSDNPNWLISAHSKSSAEEQTVKASLDGGRNWFNVGTEGNTNIIMNNDSHWLTYSPAVHFMSGTSKAFVFHHEKPSTSQLIYGRVYDFADPQGFPSKAVLNSNNPIIDSGGTTTIQQLQVRDRAGKLYIFGESTPANEMNFNVSNDEGVTWQFATGAPQKVKDGASVQTFVTSSNYYAEVVDNGVGGNRMVVMAQQQSAGVFMNYSNDDGLNWQPRIFIRPGNNSYIYSYGKFGNKIALLVHDTDVTNELHLYICEDITAASPTWQQSYVLQGGDPIDTFNGRNGGSTANWMRNNESLVWLNENELLVAYSQTNNSFAGNREIQVAHVDITAGTADPDIVYTTKQPFLQNVSPQAQFIVPKFITSPSGKIYLTAVMQQEVTLSLNGGRLVAKEVELGPFGFTDISRYNLNSDGDNFTNLIDVAFKIDILTGGSLNFPVIKKGSVMFRKDNASSIQQIYFNDVHPKDDSE